MKLIKSLVLSLALLSAVAANANVIPWSATLSGAQEVPSVLTGGTGAAFGTIDTATGDFSWAILAGNSDGSSGALSGMPFAAHFHIAPLGMNGPVLIDLFNSGAMADSSWTVFTAIKLNFGVFFLGQGTLGTASLGSLLDGNFYINVHTALHPGGEIRGQVSVPEPGTFGLLGIGLLGLGLARRKSA